MIQCILHTGGKRSIQPQECMTCESLVPFHAMKKSIYLKIFFFTVIACNKNHSPSLANAVTIDWRALDDWLVVGTLVYYECDLRYLRDPPTAGNYSKCQPNRSWSAPNMTCGKLFFFSNNSKL